MPIKKDMFNKELFKTDDGYSLDLVRNNIIICGQSQSGKSLLLTNMLYKHFVHIFKHDKIYIFSKTATIDLLYRPLI